MLLITAQPIRNLLTPASADMNKRGFWEQASPPLPLFPFLPIPYPLPLSTPATQAIEYRSTKKHGNSDCLSRLPIRSEGSSEGVDEVKLINTLQIESLPMNVDQVLKATRKDPILSRVLQFVMTGWPDKQIKMNRKPRTNLPNVTKLQSKMVVCYGEFAS